MFILNPSILSTKRKRPNHITHSGNEFCIHGYNLYAKPIITTEKSLITTKNNGYIEIIRFKLIMIKERYT